MGEINKQMETKIENRDGGKRGRQDDTRWTSDEQNVRGHAPKPAGRSARRSLKNKKTRTRRRRRVLGCRADVFFFSLPERLRRQSARISGAAWR